MIAGEECDTRWHVDDHCLKKATAIDEENDKEREKEKERGLSHRDKTKMRLKCQMSHSRSSETVSFKMFLLA